MTGLTKIVQPHFSSQLIKPMAAKASINDGRVSGNGQNSQLSAVEAGTTCATILCTHFKYQKGSLNPGTLWVSNQGELNHLPYCRAGAKKNTEEHVKDPRQQKPPHTSRSPLSAWSSCAPTPRLRLAAFRGLSTLHAWNPPTGRRKILSSTSQSLRFHVRQEGTSMNATHYECHDP